MNDAELEQLKRLHQRFPHSLSYYDWTNSDVSLEERQLEHQLENSINTLRTLLTESKDRAKNNNNHWSNIFVNSFNFQRFRNDRDHAIRAIGQIPFQLPPTFDTQIYEEMVWHIFYSSSLIFFVFLSLSS